MPAKKRRRSRSKGARKGLAAQWGRHRRAFGITLALLLAAGAGWLFWPFWQLSGQFEERGSRQPSRLYGRSTLLHLGSNRDSGSLDRELASLGYRKVTGGELERGEYAAGPGGVRVHLRSFPTRWGWSRGGLLEVAFSRAGVRSLTWRGNPVDRALLEPPLLATYYGPERQERRPVTLDELPPELTRAVLAAEDAGFFGHAGISPTGVVRALWVNLRQGEMRQGGSTLTQQLVKNLFLTHSRTLGRKLREAVLALLVDLRYDKRTILSAYLNEIYWGGSRSVSLMGVGAAAWAYFGKEARDLDLCESALLAGIIPSPGNFSPVAHPEIARERRDLVLKRMAELGWIGAERAAEEAARPLCVDPHPVGRRTAPYFADRAVLEAEERFGVDGLAEGGYVLLSTLGGLDQQAAESAAEWGLEALENGWEKGRKTAGPLQAALVSIEPDSGAILAYVGGRNYRASQFDRAGRARRQAGSAFKPVVYATAFEDRVATPATLLEDAPLRVALAGRDWSPQNSDSSFRGWVTARTAVEESLNVPTARLALEVGLDRVVSTARAMGMASRLSPVPSLALGAFELTPVELASVYATIAAGGVRHPVHALGGVLDRAGDPIEGRPLPPPERGLSAETAYLLTSVLQGVLARGTAESVRVQGLTDPLAGKTGTTNDRRDSWFAGFSPERTTLVWVGYDDNSTSRLSGARAALPIWGRFTWAVRPRGGYRRFEPPAGVVTATIDPLSGELATSRCPRVLTEAFVQGAVPRDLCYLHDGYMVRGRSIRGHPRGPERRGWRWLRRIFKPKQKRDRPPGP